MAVNIILDGLPYSVTVGGAEYPINAGFRTSILFELMVEDSKLSNAEKIHAAIDLYYPGDRPESLKDAMDQIVWFYACGEQLEDRKRRTRTAKVDSEDEDEEELTDTGQLMYSGERLYSFEFDAPYIYAAFMEQYGIDLTEIADEDMHWWKFRALMYGLNENVHFVKIMQYRGTKIKPSMTREQKEFYRKMQKLYALPLPEEEEERQNALIEALMAGEDIEHLL